MTPAVGLQPLGLLPRRFSKTVILVCTMKGFDKAAPLVFVDVETTGTSAVYGNIIEIAALRYENGECVDAVKSFVNPGRPVPRFITGLTGITTADVAGAPPFAQLSARLLALFDGAAMVAHNARFDYSFLKQEFARLGIHFKTDLICTVRLSRKLFPGQKRHRLQDLIAAHNLSFQERHRAYDDAYALVQFWHDVVLARQPEHIAAAVVPQLRTPSIPRHIDADDIARLPHGPGVYFFMDEHDYPLYIGKSIDIKKRVLSHFSKDSEDAKEFKMSQSVKRITYTETAGELSALLLESRLVKQYLPLYNMRLRRAHKLAVTRYRTNAQGYIEMRQDEYDTMEAFNPAEVMAVHPRRSLGVMTADWAVKTFELCPKLCGLEKSKGACFAYQLKKCRGACVGRESAEAYNARVRVAYEHKAVEQWPYRQPVAVVERHAESGLSQATIVDRWVVQSVVVAQDDCAPTVEQVDNGFDLDSYLILQSHLRHKASAVEVVPYHGEYHDVF